MIISSIKKVSEYVHRLVPGYYNLLLVSLAILFIFRPFQESSSWVGFWKIWLVVTLLMSLYNINFKRTIRVLALIFSIPSIGFTWLSLFYKSEYIEIAIGISTILFMTICTISILADVIMRAKVTLETLRGVICVYVLFGFIFAYLYFVAENYIPHSMLIRSEYLPVFPNPDYFFSQMLYFSFVTLLTVGFGDIVPVGDLTQTFCVIEGMIGQFYIAILVARLVAVYSLYSNEQNFAALQKTIANSKKSN